MAKSADAFRTISEVADWLGSPAHVLRFWESKFTQVKPVKRAGGRRYYRPADMLLLGGIKKLLHDDGMTIKGVQKVLREQGVKYVSSLSDPLDADLADDVDGSLNEDAREKEADVASTDAAASEAKVLPFQRELEAAVEQYGEQIKDDEPEWDAPSNDVASSTDESVQAEDDSAALQDVAQDTSAPFDGEAASVTAPGPIESTAPSEDVLETLPEKQLGQTPRDATPIEGFTAPAQDIPAVEPAKDDKPSLISEVEDADGSDAEEAVVTSEFETSTAEIPPEAEVNAPIPSFLAGSSAETLTEKAAAESSAHPSTEDDDAAAQIASPEESGQDTPEQPAPLKPEEDAASSLAETPEAPHVTSTPRAEVIDLPPDPSDDEITASPGVLSRVATFDGRRIPADRAPEIRLLRDRLAALRARSGGAESHM
ncbi:MerR family transcriptional regulator [Rhodalgimonas zhirmunskyi]|uniref:MerR family transcriptional regulator n=1 Tax=Rhodalgimonas zhirmunskyi TaxID=2964767 RepID=A0AAJ1X4G1_9RHOB|nr:MerR family transcriptional regulator [Rhodoalgimonas zhirmunskyi]MDQ2093094.1 MerR family transcriptional regulator [Rhodoalgimonas zhirmunskyi]